MASWSDIIHPSTWGGDIEQGVQALGNGVKAVGADLGLTHAAPPDPSQGPDAAADRDFATGLRQQYAYAQPTAAPTLDQTYANQARQSQQANIGDLQGVANGSTATAADSLLRQGTDQAARNATGLAAAYSAQNPGLALRAGLAASNNAYAQAASQAGIQKAQEQAAARQQIGGLTNDMRTQDLGAAQQNQGAALQQQQLNNQYQLGLGNLATSATIAPINASVANQQIQSANNAQNTQGIGSIYSSTGSFLENELGGSGKSSSSSTSSDSRMKTNIKSRSLADAMGDQVRGVVEYSYQPGQADGGKHVGIVAQDLEKVAPGLVSKDERGMRKVDNGHAAMFGLGLAAELANRVRKLEKARQL